MMTLKLTPEQYSIIVDALEKADKRAKKKDKKLALSSYRLVLEKIYLG